MAETTKNKGLLNRRKSGSTARKSGIMKKKSGTKTEEKEDGFKQWSEMKEEMETDNFIYGLHEELVNKALEDITEQRLTEERVRNLVQSFCNAWLKLVKWRWMVKDDRGLDISRENEEPCPCPKDAWSFQSYGDPMENKLRTSLPAPLKCCPHPDLELTQERTVEKPTLERVIRTLRVKSEVKEPVKPRIEIGKMFKFKGKSAVSEPMTLPHKPAIPKTAYPERAVAKIFMGTQVAEKKKGTSPGKSYTSEMDITDSQVNYDCRRKPDCQQYSRLDF